MKRISILGALCALFIWPAIAHNVLVNGVSCPGATVSADVNGVVINTTNCLVPVTPPVTPPVPPPVVPPPVVTPPVNSDLSIDGYLLPSPSKLGFVIPGIHPGANGAGQEVNAWAMSPTRCVSNPSIQRSWQHNIDLTDYKGKNAFDFFEMPGNEALTYKFTVPTIDTSGGFIYNDGANALVRPTFISISSSPCDFDRTKIGTNACYQTGINGNSVNWANISGELPVSYCRLVKGQTVYMNLRFQDARTGVPPTDSCTAGMVCGGIIQVL